MKLIGVRELRQNASEHLRLVQKGESIEITDRGRPIAMLVPMTPGTSQLDVLERQGRLSSEAGDLLELGAPLIPAVGLESASDALKKMRENSR